MTILTTYRKEVDEKWKSQGAKLDMDMDSLTTVAQEFMYTLLSINQIYITDCEKEK